MNVFTSFVKILYSCDYLQKTEISGTLCDVYNTIIPTQQLFWTLYIYIYIYIYIYVIYVVLLALRYQ